jgi:hypothetical protein
VRIISLKAGDKLLPLGTIKHVEIDKIEQGEAVIVTHDGDRFSVFDVDAIEAIMVLKPSSLEGKRLKWKKNAWAVHNLIAHPLMQILAWMGLKKLAIRIHDATIPTPVGFR